MKFSRRPRIAKIIVDAWFWQNVDKSGSCWIWTRCIDRLGYGRFWLRDGVQIKAHRAAWTFSNGPIPAGFDVCHKCDNRACVNPSHLFLGTHVDNMRDMKTKGRLKVIAGHNAKFDRKQVEEIRALFEDGTPCPEIAKRFGIDRGTAWRIATRRVYKQF